MGILSSGLRAKIFFSLWWSLRNWLLLLPPNACRGERCGVWGRRAPQGLGLCFVLERFLFVFGERFCLLGQSAIRKRTNKGSAPAL